MAQAIKIIEGALKRIGVLAAGESPTGEDVRDAFDALGTLLDSWSTESLTIYRTDEIAHALTGAMSYTIGPGADIDVQRPISVYSAFVRDSGGFDTPVWVVGDDKFDGIHSKVMAGRPEYLRYLPSMPAGRIDLWPNSGVGLTLHLRVGMQFDQPILPGDVLGLPPGYRRALELALAVELCDIYQRDVTQSLLALAVEAKANIMRANIKIETALFDPALTQRPGGFGYFLAGD